MKSKTERDDGRAFTVGRLSKRWDCSPQTIYNEINAGSLPSFKVRNKRLIPHDAVMRRERGQSASEHAA